MIKVEEKIDYLVGKDFKNRKILEPFNKIICDFLIDLSSDLNQFNNPDIKALAFWCRNANIMRLKNLYKTSDLRLGLGLIFHITPSNIPTNFAYSLIFGLITGNSNIVKVPSKKFEEIDIICKSIKKTLKKDGNLITLDPIYVNDQNYFARFLISHDRGKNIKTKKEYLKILKLFFKNSVSRTYNQSFIPYTWFSMNCRN